MQAIVKPRMTSSDCRRVDSFVGAVSVIPFLALGKGLYLTLCRGNSPSKLLPLQYRENCEKVHHSKKDSHPWLRPPAVEMYSGIPADLGVPT